MDLEVPIVKHAALPNGVPLIADFNDDRNRLSYYYPILEQIQGVRVPITSFFAVNGDLSAYPDVDYKEISSFMVRQQMRSAFVRGDYTSGKYDGEQGSKITSQDAYDIEDIVLEMFTQIFKSKRNLGSRIAVREWIPHNREVRYFIRGGDVLYRDSLDDGDEFPDDQIESVVEQFNTFSWSVDFIRHENTGKWYCIDMGLDGLYYDGDNWVSISEHLNKDYSPETYSGSMGDWEEFKRRR